jgi:phospholipid transport system substrate-binding protein
LGRNLLSGKMPCLEFYIPFYIPSGVLGIQPVKVFFMSRYLHLVFGMFVLCGTFVAPVSVVAAEAVAGELTAEAAVQAYIGDLLNEIKTIQPLYETDKSAYFDGVENSLDKFVDFKEVARGVMAKYGTGPNGANDEQMSRFADVFKSSLVHFYGNALASYGGVVFEIVPPAEQPSADANTANVVMNIMDNKGGKFKVQYTMFKNSASVWKLKNLYIEGVNLRRQYYSQFDSMMMSNNYDIDKVIDSWAAAVSK